MDTVKRNSVWPKNRFFLVGNISYIESTEKYLADGTPWYSFTLRTEDIILDHRGSLRTYFNEFPISVNGQYARFMKPRLIVGKKIFVEGSMESCLKELNIPVPLADGKEEIYTIFEFKKMFLVADRIGLDYELVKGK